MGWVLNSALDTYSNLYILTYGMVTWASISPSVEPLNDSRHHWDRTRLLYNRVGVHRRARGSGPNQVWTVRACRIAVKTQTLPLAFPCSIPLTFKVWVCLELESMFSNAQTCRKQPIPWVQTMYVACIDAMKSPWCRWGLMRAPSRKKPKNKDNQSQQKKNLSEQRSKQIMWQNRGKRKISILIH